MSKVRQQLMFLCLSSPELDSPTVAWSLYDGALPDGQLQMNSGDSAEPPYASVLAAMKDGWNVIHIPMLSRYPSGHEHETSHLPYEYGLERKVEISG
jgi:hypothetical protein